MLVMRSFERLVKQHKSPLNALLTRCVGGSLPADLPPRKMAVRASAPVCYRPGWSGWHAVSEAE